MSNLEFAVGKRVVCIKGDHSKYFADNPLHPWLRSLHYPETNQVYTIRGFSSLECKEGPSLLLEEIVNPPTRYAQGFGEAGFYISRFRPVRETSIECFTKLLETPPVKEREPAL